MSDWYMPGLYIIFLLEDFHNFQLIFISSLVMLWVFHVLNHQIDMQITILEMEKSSSQQNFNSVFDLATEQTISAQEKYEKVCAPLGLWLMVVKVFFLTCFLCNTIISVVMP